MAVKIDLTIVALIASLSISISAGKQQPKTPAVPASRISGTILDGTTNKPVSGVIIAVLQGTGRHESVTDSSGQFSINVTHGTVRLITAKTGYASIRPENHNLPTDGVLISVSPAQQIRNLALHIWPTGSLSGAVYDAKSKPVQYARAQLMRYIYDDDGKRVLRSVGAGRGGETNDHGEFQITDVDPGDYYLQIDPPFFAERVPGEPFTSPRPTPVTVKSGTQNNVGDLTLPSVRGATIRIHLVNQTGQPVQNTMSKYLHWNRRNDAGTSTVVPLLIMGGPERAEIPVPVGIYSVTAGWMTGADNSQPLGLGNTIVEVGQNVNVDIAVKKGIRIIGQAFLEQAKGSPKPIRGVRCDFASDAFPTLSATSEPDGSIPIENIQSTVYQMNCTSALPDAYITAIKQGDRDVLKQGLQVGSNEEVNAFTVSFNQAAAVLEGKVVDPKSRVNGALVVLVPDDPLRNSKYLYRSVVADQNGTFSIRAVAPGAYHLFAWTELEGATYRNADFMKQYDEQGTAVKVTSAEKKTGIETKLLE